MAAAQGSGTQIRGQLPRRPVITTSKATPLRWAHGPSTKATLGHREYET